MTSQLHPKEVQLFRCLKKTSILLMLLFRLDRPVGESEIASILDMYPTTVRTYLRSLSHLGVVTRTHRYNGWTLTAGGRQMILGESTDETLAAQTGKIKTSVKNSRSSVEISRSLPAAAASLSLSFKEESNAAAIAQAGTSVKNSRSRVKISRSRFGRKKHIRKKEDRTVHSRARSDPVVRANLEAFASIGLARNDFVQEICKMDHVTPDYIRGQKKRLEAERRYSHGLLLTVIRSNDYLPDKYITHEEPESQLTEDEPELQEKPDVIQEVEPDPSIYEPISTGGMTAERAWSAALRQLKVDMPKSAYDAWLKDTVLLSAEHGIFLVAARSAYARDWLESRAASTLRRQLTGTCNRPVQIRFVNINELKAQKLSKLFES
jgi:predicted transcriptional regulator